MIRFGQFEKELAKMSKKTEGLIKSTQKMRKSLDHWLGSEGLLNKKQAEHLTLEIQVALWMQEFPGADVRLHPFTLYMRERMGISGKKVGVATGTMMNAIQSIHEGSGKYSVGIPEGERVSEGGGSYKYVRETAWIFEFGRVAKRINPRGSKSMEHREIVSKPVHEQPARPFFWPTVSKFIRENLERNAQVTIYKAWMSAAKEWQRFGGDQYGGGLTVQDFAHQAVGIQESL